MEDIEQDEVYELKNFMAAYCKGSKCQNGSLNSCFWCIAKALYAAGYRKDYRIKEAGNELHR